MKRVLIFGLLFFMIGLSLFVGIQSIPIQDILQMSNKQVLVFWGVRFPRTISLVVVGATTSICGLIMQHLTQNKYVSPTTSGTMDSARLGIVCSMLVLPQASFFQKSVLACFFAFGGSVLFLKILQWIPKKSQIMVPLLGVMFGNVIGSIATFIAYQFQVIQNMNAWLQGNFSTVVRGDYEMLYITLPLLALIYFYAYEFTLAGMGKSLAESVGLKYQKVQFIGLFLVSLISSITLITIGSLPFLGVIIPNIVSLMYGDHMKSSLPITAISGSIFLLFCDIVARSVIAPYEVPVSLIVGMIGSIVFLGLLVKGRKK